MNETNKLAFRRFGVSALILVILILAVAGCATHNKKESVANSPLLAKIEAEITYFENLLSYKEQQQNPTSDWNMLARQFRARVDACSSLECLKIVAQDDAVLTELKAEKNQIERDIIHLNEKYHTLKSHINSLTPEQIEQRFTTAEKRFINFTFNERQRVFYAKTMIQYLLDAQNRMMIIASQQIAPSDALPILAPQLLCDTTSIGTHKNYNDLVGWFKSNTQLVGPNDQKIPVIDLGVGKVVAVNSSEFIVNDSLQWDALIIKHNEQPSLSILYITKNNQVPHSYSPTRWIGKTCQLSGQVVEVRNSQSTGCSITLDNHESDFSKTCHD